ncbi:MAG: sensor histidine kinase [Solirubrobacteraceae bacterium]
MPQRAHVGMPGMWVAAVATAAAALAVWVTLSADFLAYPGWLAAQKADIILGPVLVGLYWLRRRPASRFGPLLIVVGLVGGVPYILQSSSEPVLFAGGILWEGVIYALTLALILSFPSGRLEGRVERALLAVGATASLGAYLTLVLFSPQIASQSSISACAAACPENGLLVAAEPALVLEVVRVGRVGVILVALAAVGFIVWRVVAGTPPRRRALVVGAPVAVVFLLSQAAYQTARLLEIEGDAFYSVAQWMLVGSRPSIWYGFLVALIAAELFAGRVLRRVLIESLRRPELGELETMLREPIGDPGLRLAFRRPGGAGWVGVPGDPIAVQDLPTGCVLTEVERDGQAAAAIVHDAQLAEEPELLRAAGAVALLAQENVQLEAAWSDSLLDLQESRRRIVAASEAERRRLERDLHDGAQQRLISLRIGLAIASEQAAADPAISARLGQLEQDVDGAIEELRDLAHGIFPSVLADRGLVPALRAVGRRGPRPIEVTGRRIGRYPPEIESAVYYCCLEALQNATKHGGPAVRIAARLTAQNGELRLVVSDDGPGIAVAAVHSGDGLRNMEDRLGAVHGQLAIVSSPGNGTVVSGVVPVNGAGR